MNQPASCRAALEAALPYLRKEPDRLVMFIEDGKIAASLGGPGFEYRYTLTIGLLDFNQVWTPNAAVLIVALAETERDGDPLRWAPYDLGQAAATEEVAA